MNVWLIIAIVIFALGLLSLSIWLWIILTKEKKKIPNGNLILNFMTQYSQGYALGEETSTKKIKGRELISFSPKDVNPTDIERLVPINDQEVVADKNHIITIPSGNLSDRRCLKIILPPNPEDFPDNFKLTSFGRVLMNYVEEINAENTVTSVMRKRIVVENRLLNKTEGMDRVEEYVELDEELNAQLAKKMVNEAKNPDKNLSNRYPGSNP